VKLNKSRMLEDGSFSGAEESRRDDLTQGRMESYQK